MENPMETVNSKARPETPSGAGDKGDALFGAARISRGVWIRRLAEKNIPNCAGFSFGFKARGRRIASLLTAVQRTSWTIKTSKLVCSLIEIALGDWQKRIYQIAQDFRSDSRHNNRGIVHYVTVIAT